MPAIQQLARAFPPEIAVVLVAALPVIELRGALPLGITLGLDPSAAFALSVLGNMLPMPFIIKLLEPFTRALRRMPRISKAIEDYYTRTHAKSSQIKRYGFWGLVVFVAIPLPSTGAWTGAVAASLLGLRFWPAMLALLLGTFSAGIIVMSLWLFGLSVMPIY